MKHLVAQALARWGWASAPCRFVAGRENQVYRVRAPEGDFALRIKRPAYRTEAELRAELQWLAALADAGISVPRPQAALSGDALVSVDGYWVDAVSWLPGEPLGRSGQALAADRTPATFGCLGKAMAELHLACDRWQPPPTFTRCDWGVAGLLGEQPLWGRFWENPSLDADTRGLLQGFRQQALACLREASGLDHGLIHADCVRENVLLDGAQIRLIDLDDGGYGFRLFDLATALIKNRLEPAYPELRAALLSAYQSVRPIDVELLDLFMALRAVTYVGWIVPRMNEPGSPERQQRFVRDARELCGAWLARL